MHLVLISPEGEDARERVLLPKLFAAGLERYHLRKPGWAAERMAERVAELPAEFRARVVVHSHHELVEKLGLGGRHWPDRDGVPGVFAADEAASKAAGAPPPRKAATPGCLKSRSCHSLKELDKAFGKFDAVFFGPMFASISKPGRRPAANLKRSFLRDLLGREDVERARTAVIALGGVRAERVALCAEMGFDGVAALGAVWAAEDPFGAFCGLRDACGANGIARGRNPEDVSLPRRPPVQRASAETTLPERRSLPWLMCLTQDGLSLSHQEQVRRLCAAGAKWIQVRMKEALDGERVRVARACVQICREHGALCIINDRVDVAREVEADGAHLGKADGDWNAARRTLGPNAVLGGTVNEAGDAARAAAAGCLDYVGVGPLRFTATKHRLSPVLGLDGIRELLPRLGGLPAWVIGGVIADDVAGIFGAGAAGVAVSAALYRDGEVERRLAEFLRIRPGTNGAYHGPGLNGTGSNGRHRSAGQTDASSRNSNLKVNP